MTNKTFLILLLAGVSYTAYNAAAVSENFEISTTIDHDVNIQVIQDLNLGNIVIRPDITNGEIVSVGYNGNGDHHHSSGIIAISGIKCGKIRANIPGLVYLDSRLDVSPFPLIMEEITIHPVVRYMADDGLIRVWADVFYETLPQQKIYTGTITISYTAS